MGCSEIGLCLIIRVDRAHSTKWKLLLRIKDNYGCQMVTYLWNHVNFKSFKKMCDEENCNQYLSHVTRRMYRIVHMCQTCTIWKKWIKDQFIKLYTCRNSIIKCRIFSFKTWLKILLFYVDLGQTSVEWVWRSSLL